MRAVLLLEVWCWTACGAFLVWPSVYVLAAGLVPVGLAIPSTDSVVNGYRIAITPDRLLGRSESVRNAISLSISSLSPLAAGLLLQHTTPRWTIACYTAWALALAVWGTRSSVLRHPPSPPDRGRDRLTADPSRDRRQLTTHEGFPAGPRRAGSRPPSLVPP